MTRGIRPVRLPRVSALVAVARVVAAAVLFVLSVALPAAAQPSAPTGFAASNGNEQVTLTWDAPAADADIARHEYRFKTTGDYPAEWTGIDDSAPGGLHEDWVVVTGLTNDVAYTFQLRAVNAGGDASTVAEAGPATPRSGVCGRTEQVRDAIVAAIAGVSDCADVTTAQLAGVTDIGVNSLRVKGIKSLQPGDFSGLTALATLHLDHNELSSLPAGVFSGLTSLEGLWLYNNELSSLPAGVFSGLTSLTTLNLARNRLSSLPAGVFSGLNLTVLPTLQGNGSSSSDLLPLTVTLERNPDAAEIRAVVLAAAPAAVSLRVSVANGQLAGGATTITVPAGARESAWVGVTRTEGTTGTGDRGHRPDHPAGTMPRGHDDPISGLLSYAFVRSASDLPLRVLDGAPDAPSVSAASSSSLTVMWSAPDDGGSAITDYDVRYRAGASGDWTDGSHDGPATTATLTGLASGTTYEVQVRATNNLGTGPWSPSGSGATDGQAVPAPTGFAASNGNEQVTLTWDAPAADADIARHEYRFKTTGDYPAEWTGIDDSAPGGLHEDWVVVTGLTNDVAYTFQLRAVNAGGDASTWAEAGPATPRSGVCGRTEQVRDAIVIEIAGVSDCADVTTAQLAGVTDLNLNSSKIKSLQSGDFSGMAALESLSLGSNELSSLPAGVFSGMAALRGLYLWGNDLTSLPAGVFSGLTALQVLWLTSNELSSLPAGVFSGLTALGSLWLEFNELSSLPDGAFSGLTVLRNLRLRGNAVDPLPLTVTLEKNPDAAEIRAVVPAAAPRPAPFAVSPRVSVANGQLAGGATTITVPAGARESAWVGVTRTDGTTGAVTADIDLSTQPTRLDYDSSSSHEGYAFVRSASDLPLRVLRGAPGAPDAPSVSAASSSRLTAMWSAPDDGGSAITDYDVRYRAGTSGDWSDGSHDGPATTATLTGLASGTTYEVQVRATNNQGAGAWSPSGSGATDGQAVPAPTGFEASNGNEQVTLTWDDPAEDADIARHEYRFKTTGDYPAEWTGIEESAPGGLHEDWVVVTGLANDVAYTFQLRAVNAAGDASTAAEAGPATPRSGVCGRTEQVRDAIVAAIAGVSDCADVTTTQLADVWRLELGSSGITSLQAGDFSGLTALQQLRLHKNELTSLPAGVFSGLTALNTLQLHNNELTSLPAGVFSGLTALYTLWLSNNELTSLPDNVFSGLTALNTLWLSGNEFSSLPDNVFSGLTALRTLYLSGGEFSSLPAGVFSGLTALNTLVLSGTELTSLPDNVFSGLTALEQLGLNGNEFSSLPDNVFSGLTALNTLDLSGTELSSLPDNVFSGLTALERLLLNGNKLSSLPADVFSGITALVLLYLDNNAEDPLPLAVTLERNPDAAEIRAVVPAAAPFAVPLSVSVENGGLAGGAATITVPAGARESAWVGVTRTAGTTGAVTADIDLTTQPTLPYTSSVNLHRGYAFVKSATDLPLTVLRGAPDAPSVSAASSSSLTVMWSAPDDGGSAITDYDVQYRAGASGDWTDGSHDGPATTATLTGLASGTTYEVQVRATNNLGTGPWSPSGSGATDGQAVPAPTGFAASNGNEQVTLTWDDAGGGRGHRAPRVPVQDHRRLPRRVDGDRRQRAGRAPRGLGRGDGPDQRRGLHVPVARGERRRRRQHRGRGGSGDAEVRRLRPHRAGARRDRG